MNLEEELRRSADTLADRLRDEVARHLETVASDLQATVQTERKSAGIEAARIATATAEREALKRLTIAVAEAEARVHETGRAEGRAVGLEDGRAEGREAGLTDGRAEGREAGFADGRAKGLEEGLAHGLENGRVQGLEEAHSQSRESDSAVLERLVEAARSIDGARSLSEILDLLVGAATREAARISLLIITDEGLQSWKYKGFGPALDEASPFAMPLSDAGLIAEAVRTAGTTSADSTDDGLQPGFALLPSGRRMLAVPLTMSGQVVAVLYGDQGESGDGRGAWPAALEMLARHAARSLEALTAFRAAKLLAGSAEAPHGHDTGQWRFGAPWRIG